MLRAVGRSCDRSSGGGRPCFNGDDLPTGTFTQTYQDVAVDYGFASADDLLDYVWVTQWNGMARTGTGS